MVFALFINRKVFTFIIKIYFNKLQDFIVFQVNVHSRWNVINLQKYLFTTLYTKVYQGQQGKRKCVSGVVFVQHINCVGKPINLFMSVLSRLCDLSARESQSAFSKLMASKLEMVCMYKKKKRGGGVQTYPLWECMYSKTFGY